MGSFSLRRPGSSVEDPGRERGFSFTELAVVMFCGAIVVAMAVPSVTSMLDRYRLISAAQSISSQLHYARMKAVSSNEEIRCYFTSSFRTYQLESSGGTVLAGPFYLPSGILWNSDCGTAITFTGNYVGFQTTGNLPTSGSGSAGRISFTNRAGEKIDVVVSAGGIIRQTTPYTGCTPPF